jgi:hypothetical protein
MARDRESGTGVGEFASLAVADYLTLTRWHDEQTRNASTRPRQLAPSPDSSKCISSRPETAERLIAAWDVEASERGLSTIDPDYWTLGETWMLERTQDRTPP